MSTQQQTTVQAVEVTSIKKINKGSLRCFVDVVIAGKLTIHDVRVIQQEGQAAWVSMPQREVPAKDGGKPKYYPVVEINDEKLKSQIASAVLSAFGDSAKDSQGETHRW